MRACHRTALPATGFPRRARHLPAASNLEAEERPGQSGLGTGEVNVALAPAQPALGAVSGPLRAIAVDLVRTLGVLGQHDDLVVPDFGEAAGQRQVRLARARAVRQLADTVKSFREIVDGKHDALPEQAFYMVGDIGEAIDKAKKLREAA